MAPLGLMDLPSEIRLIILENVFAKAKVHESHDRRGTTIMKENCHLAIAHANKVLHNESMPIFYRNVKLVLSSTDKSDILKTQIPAYVQIQIKTAYCSQRFIRAMLHKYPSAFPGLDQLIVTKYLNEKSVVRTVTSPIKVGSTVLHYRITDPSVSPAPAVPGIKRKRDGTIILPDGSTQSKYAFRMQQWRDWGVYPLGCGPRNWCDKKIHALKDLDALLKMLLKRVKDRGHNENLDALIEDVRADRKALEKELFIDEVYDVDN